MCSVKAFAICCAFAMFGWRTSTSLDVCTPFNKTSGLKELCGYGTTVKFLQRSHFDNAVKTAKSLIKSLNSCSPYANLIICSSHIPRCVSNIEGPYLPCRRVCDEFKSKCANEIRFYGLEWIIGACQLLPQRDDPYSGYLGRCFEPQGFKTNLPVEGDSKSLKCYPLTIQKCQNIGYNSTIVDTERQHALKQFLDNVLSKKENETIGCTISRKKFICTEHLPACIDNKVAIYCRDKCKDFFDRKCTPVFGYQKDICMEFPKGNSSIDICKRNQWPRAENWFAARHRPTTQSAIITSLSATTTDASTSAPTSHSTTESRRDRKAVSSGFSIAPCWSIGIGFCAFISFRSLF